ncbi:MAG: hypothetical protein ACJAT7_001886 [Psychromonas sp.]|jgi:hypothetical protein
MYIYRDFYQCPIAKCICTVRARKLTCKLFRSGHSSVYPLDLVSIDIGYSAPINSILLLTPKWYRRVLAEH